MQTEIVSEACVSGRVWVSASIVALSTWVYAVCLWSASDPVSCPCPHPSPSSDRAVYLSIGASSSPQTGRVSSPVIDPAACLSSDLSSYPLSFRA